MLSEPEALQMEKRMQDFAAESDRPSDLSQELPKGNVGGYNVFWFDPANKVANVKGERRSSLITYPADGQVPALSEPGQQRLAARTARAAKGGFDGPEVRALGERCILGFGSNSGPPMLPVMYNSNYQIVQSGNTVLIHVEMVHDARIIRLGGHASAGSHAQMDGRLHRPLGRRHAGGRDHQLQSGAADSDRPGRDLSQYPGVTEAQGDRALHSHRRANHPLRIHGRGSRHVQHAVAWRDSVPLHQPADLRVRLPRRQLRAARHPCRCA